MRFPFVGVLESLSNEVELTWSFESFERLPLPPLILFRRMSDLEFCLIKLDAEFVLDDGLGWPELLFPPTAITKFRFIEVGVSDFNDFPVKKI